MKKMYSSATLQELTSKMVRLNKSGLLPHGYPSKLAEENNLKTTCIQNALGGKKAAIECIRAVVEACERAAGMKVKKVEKRKVRHLTITEIYDQGLLPTKYSKLAAPIAGSKPNAIRYFIKNQLEGREAYASTEPTKEALYQITEMNEEWELLNRANRILEKIA